MKNSMSSGGVYKQPEWHAVVGILGFLAIFGIIIGVFPPDITGVSLTRQVMTGVLGFVGLLGVVGILSTAEGEGQLGTLRGQVQKNESKLAAIRRFKIAGVVCALAAPALLVMGIMVSDHLCFVGALNLILYATTFYLFGRDILPYYDELEAMKRDKDGT